MYPNLLDTKFYSNLNFGTKIIFAQNIFLDIEFFDPYCLDPKSLWSNFLLPTFFWTNIS